MPKEKGQESPFIYGRMITEPDLFWGREKEINDLQDRLWSMQSTSIVGPRRIGKSSLAYYIYCTARIIFDDSFKFVWLDGQSNHANSVQSFCEEVTSRATIAFTADSAVPNCLKNFEDAIWSCGKKLVLIINEFELLTDENHANEFNIKFFSTLRYLAEHGKCALITTSNKSIQDLCKHVLGVSSPFYNILPQITLSKFTEEESLKYLENPHKGVVLEAKEIEFIKSIPNYCHPLILQVACHHSFANRINNLAKDDVFRIIVEQSNSLLNHDKVHKEREMEKKQHSSTKENKPLDKSVDMTLSFLVPVIAIGLLMLEFFLVIRNLDLTKTVILAIFSSLVGFAVIIFAGRSINIIGETSFFKLFVKIIEQIPLLSNVLTTITNAVEKFKK